MEKKLDNLSKRGKKGGTKFPNYSLKQILPCLKELISKTTAKPTTIEQLSAGVFKMKAKSAEGKIKYSSLKQFGLAGGEYTKITSTKLASQIVLASEGEKSVYLREAFLNAPTFKNVFETFQDSSVQKLKIAGYSVSNLKIHIDASDKFLKSLLDSCEVAKMCTISGDEVNFINGKEANNTNNNDLDGGVLEREEDENSEDSKDDFQEDENFPEFKTNTNNQKNKPNIDLKIDPTLDADKLEKQLKVLRKYGLI